MDFIHLLNIISLILTTRPSLSIPSKIQFLKKKYEIIFIDDGSTDNTFSSLKRLRTADKNVKIIMISPDSSEMSAVGRAENGSYITLVFLPQRRRGHRVLEGPPCGGYIM